jgi:hypothetical protein
LCWGLDRYGCFPRCSSVAGLPARAGCLNGSVAVSSPPLRRSPEPLSRTAPAVARIGPPSRTEARQTRRTGQREPLRGKDFRRIGEKRVQIRAVSTTKVFAPTELKLATGDANACIRMAVTRVLPASWTPRHPGTTNAGKWRNGCWERAGLATSELRSENPSYVFDIKAAPKSESDGTIILRSALEYKRPSFVRHTTAWSCRLAAPRLSTVHILLPLFPGWLNHVANLQRF